MIYCDKAYAKVNLHLKVLNKRHDGYHNILSLMASVGLFDLLKLDECELIKSNTAGLFMEIIPDGGNFSSIIENTPVEKNLIYKAAKKYTELSGLSGKIYLRIQKDIPAGGGLGGGSSDAASVLRLLNAQYGLMSKEELRNCAAMVGADVPFCIDGGAAFCEGIGEKISKLPDFADLNLLIVNNGTHVDTLMAYRMIDDANVINEIKDDNKQSEMIDRITEKDYLNLFPMFENDFEEVVFAKNPSLRTIKMLMYDYGADFSIMTGSGSTVIGIFLNIDKAKKAREQFLLKNFWVYLTDFVKPDQN
jgi:4-diphosphocytidyl-2-C-methyl-D-erythritol kinase